MNERIKELAEQAGLQCNKDEAICFAELIVQECYDHCKDQLMDKSLAEEAGLDYNDGVMDCAIGLKKHFGVEE
jgi:hypothetical protein